MIDDATLLAFLDGELDAAAAARVETALATDPVTVRALERHRRLRGILRRSFDPLLDQPVPTRLAATAAGGGRVVSLTGAMVRRRLSSATQWGAVAAALMVGLISGGVLRSGAGGPVVVEQGRLIASASLADALDHALASQPSSGPVRVALSFRDHDGRFCRTFETTGAVGAACHEENGWRIAGLFPARAAPAGEYRMAASDAPGLMALVDGLRVGDPLDAAAERAARDAGWVARR